MRFILLITLLIAAQLETASIENKIDLSSVSTYSVNGIITLPYAEINEPFEAWYDESQSASRIDYYSGTVSTIQLAPTTSSSFGTGIKISPMTTEDQFNVKTCFWMNGTQDSPLDIQSVLPDLSNFTLVGKTNYKGMSVDQFQFVSYEGDKKNTYNFYANSITGYPVYYEMIGYDSLLGSHYDRYYIEYYNFKTDSIPSGVFSINTDLKCGGFPGPGLTSHVSVNPMKEFIHHDDSHHHYHFDKFKETHSIEYEDHRELIHRRHVFRQNLRYIESFNRQGKHRLAVNHLADKTDDELRYLRGNKFKKGVQNNGLPFDKTKYSLKDIPDSWDWRLYGAVTPVKDQGICGSCWSFGTTGTIEGAVFLKHNKLVRLSQQNLIDCSWGFGNNGCDGGEDFRAYDWIMKHGGLATEDSYGQYLQNNGYCHYNDSSVVIGAQLTGYVNVTPYDADALKLAIVNHGPISVAIDAGHKSFVFYSSGVFYEPDCGNKPDDLDHAVLAVGYGTLYSDNEPYWLIKNR